MSKTPIIYGPVDSRRLGTSLGINISGDFHKDRICNFDCVYCQYGRNKNNQTKLFPSFDEIKKKIFDKFQECTNSNINSISFAGTGEPTIHPDFTKIVDFIVKQRNIFFPKASITIFTNCSMLENKSIRKSLAKLDKIILKLDASDAETMKKINNFSNFNSIINGIIITAKEMDVEITTLIIMEPKEFSNFNSIKNKNYVDLIQKINPKKINLYTIDRLPAESTIEQVSTNQLLKLKDFLGKNLKIPIEVTKPRLLRSIKKWI